MNGVRRLAIPMVVVAILVGVGMGLFLGWRVWPVIWYDTDPSDLRLQHQLSWVVMVADSLAVTGDVDLARQRLFELTDLPEASAKMEGAKLRAKAEADWQWVANLVEQAAVERDRVGDIAGALRLRRMAQSLNLPLPTEEEVQVRPPRGIGPATVPNALLVLISLLAFIAALAIVIWLLLKLIQARPAAEPAAALAPSGVERVQGRTEGPPSPPAPAEAYWEEESVAEEDEEQEAFQPFTPLDATGRPSTAQPLQPTAISAEEEEISWEEPESIEEEEVEQESAKTVYKEAAPWQVEPIASPLARPAPEGALGVFEAEYRYGDDDFDTSFSIESANGEFLGECGVGVADVLDVEEVQQIDAFEVWLFDKGDIRTVSKILVSDLVYDDEELRQRLEDKGELVVARPGTFVELETLSLRLAAVVQDCRYRQESELPDAVFEFLRVELTVYAPDED
ncbi:MAG: hypothetical protein H5T69_11785 [Chloroflexi bacterium]|nr:hypothetical protein [Chloroflexota bacterium]